jgi:hypothetical protein
MLRTEPADANIPGAGVINSLLIQGVPLQWGRRYLEEKSSGSGLEIREYGCRDSFGLPRDIR